MNKKCFGVKLIICPSGGRSGYGYTEQSCVNDVNWIIDNIPKNNCNGTRIKIYSCQYHKDDMFESCGNSTSHWKLNYFCLHNL